MRLAILNLAEVKKILQLAIKQSPLDPLGKKSMI